VVILVAYREAAAVAVDDLDAAAEVEGEVELGGVRYRDLVGEVEEAPGRLAEGLDAAVAAEVEFQADGRGAGAVDGFARRADHQRRRTDYEETFV